MSEPTPGDVAPADDTVTQDPAAAATNAAPDEPIDATETPTMVDLTDDELTALEEIATDPSMPWNAPEDATATDEPTDGSKANREAARYRTRLREVEAERDGIANRLAAYEQQHVDRIAAERMVNPADFRLLGADLADLRGEDGALDEGKVREAITAALAERPHWDRERQPRLPRPNPAQGRGGQSAGARSWSDLLKQA